MTILIIGGAYQGKLDYAKREFGLNDDDIAYGKFCSSNDIKTHKAISELHEYTRRLDLKSASIDCLLDDFKDKVIICNEVGCGIVPINRSDDLWREFTGRLCCEIAKTANVVIRIFAGIPQFIKGSLEDLSNEL